MNMKILAIPLTLISVGTLAACGLPGQTQSETPAQTWHELVACARAHGMPNLPDPTIASHGQAHFPHGTPAPPAATRQACQSIYNRLPAAAPPSPPPHPPPEFNFCRSMPPPGLRRPP